MHKNNQTTDPTVNPFREDVFSSDSPLPGTPQIHEDIHARCVALLQHQASHNTGRGNILCLTSPKAGYGKTHLIRRISQTVFNQIYQFELTTGPEIDWSEWLDNALFSLESQTSKKSPSRSAADETAARFLAQVVVSGVAGNVIEEKDCPVSLATLETDFCNAFSDSQRPKLLNWLQKKNGALTSAISMPQNFGDFSKDDVAFWTDFFIAHFKTTSNNLNEGAAHARKRFLQLLRIASVDTPLLLVADHLDACHGSSTAGLEIATALNQISEKVPNSLILISVNNDIWESVFAENLPSALLDRMSSETLVLDAIEAGEAHDLMVNRLSSNGISHQNAHQFADLVGEEKKWTNKTELFPRQVIREARQMWTESGAEFLVAPEPEKRSPEPLDAEPKLDPVKQPEISFQTLTQTSEQTSAPKPPVTTNPTMPFPQPGESEEAVSPAPMPFVGESNDSLSNPFNGHSLQYPDRPSFSPFPTSEDTTLSSNAAFPTNRMDGGINHQESLQADRAQNSFLPRDAFPSQPGPAVTSQKIDEPKFGPPADSFGSTNGKINGQAHQQEPVANTPAPLPAIPEPMPEPKLSPIEVYYEQLKNRYSQGADRLKMDFTKIESLVKTVGENHRPLTQVDIHVPGGNSNCLRWDMPNFSVWIGFEPARNIYFYSNILQRLLSDPAGTPGKVVCFSHASEPFNQDLLTTNGINLELLNRYFDFVHLSNHELSLLLSSAEFLHETVEKNYTEEGLKLVLKELQPLWERICQAKKSDS